MKQLKYLVLLCALTACAEGKNYYPTLSGNPEKMSAETLCFRYANSRDPALAKEIDARNLDCAGLLSEDPLYNTGGPEMDTIHRSIGR